LTGAELTLGKARTLDYAASRSQLTESVVWQKGPHRLRFGFDWEHTNGRPPSSVSAEPAQLTLWSPQQVRQLAPTIALPASFTTLDDILQLPLPSFETGVGSGVIPQRDFRSYRIQDLYRLYASDSWAVGSRLTLDAGLGWSYEPNALNNDLTKPALLAPLLGADRLNARRLPSTTSHRRWVSPGPRRATVRWWCAAAPAATSIPPRAQTR